MKIENFNFEDGYIRGILIHQSSIEVQFELWNGSKVKVTFIDYVALKDFHSTDSETSELLCLEDTPLRQELVKDTLSGGGTLDEIKHIKSFSFISSWGDRNLLEILATDIKFSNIE